MKIIAAKNIEFNRLAIESKSCNILVSLENDIKKDDIRYLNSGLNGITARLATKNKVLIGIDIEKLRNTDKKDLSIKLARIKQNILLCRKAGTGLAYTGEKDILGAKALLLSLGASPFQVTKAVRFNY